MAESLAAVYLPIIPDASKIAPGVKTALGAVERDSEKSGRGMGTKISAGLSKTMKVGAVATGAAVGGVLAKAISGGMGRLVAIDTAEAKLSGLGHSAQGVSTIMADALASVKGTSFGLGEAASAAATAVASGVKPGKDLQRTLSLMGDAASIAGTDLGDMAAIFNKVSSTGKLQGEVLAQLGERGIPIISLLSETMGVATGDVAKLAAEGKIGFAELQSAIEHGMGGAALKAGDTFAGSMNNASAALGRLGAAAIQPFFQDGIGGIKTFTAAVDTMTDHVGPASEMLRAHLGRAASEAGTWIQGTLVPALGKIGTQAAAAGPTLKALGTAAVSVGKPMFRIGEAVAEAAASLGVSTWQIFLTTLDATAAVLQAVAPALEMVADFAENNTAAVTGMVAAFAAFKTLPTLVGRATSAFAPFTSSVSAARSGIADFQHYASETGQSMTRMEATIAYAATSSNAHVAAVGRAASQAGGGWQSFGAAAKAAATGGLAQMRSSVGSLINAMGGPLVVGIGAAVALIGAEKAAAADAKAANEALAEAVRDGEAAQIDFAAAVAGTTGALSEEGLAAAARIAKAEMAAFTTEGERQLGVVERTAHATAGFDAWLEKIPGMYTESGKAINEHNREIKASHEAYGQLESSMAELELPMSSLNEIVAAGGEDYRRLIEHLRSSGDEGIMAAEKLEAAREKIERLEEAARNMEPGFASARDAMIELGEAANEGGAGVDTLHRAMQALGLAPKDAEGAMIDAAEAADEFAQSVKDIPVNLDQGLGLDAIWTGEGFNVANGNATELYGALVPLRDELYNVAVNGGDVHEAFGRMGPGLDELATRFGMTRGELDILLNHLGIVPDHIETVYSTNLDQTRAEITGVIDALDGIPEGETVEVDLGGDAREELRRLGWHVSEELPNGNVEVTAKTEDARLRLREILLDMMQLDSREPAKPRVEPDLAGAQAALDDIGRQLGDVDGTTATPGIDVDPIAFDLGIDTAGQKLDQFDFKFASATLDADPNPLFYNTGNAHFALDGLAGRRPTPASDLNNDALSVNAGNAHFALDAVDGRRPLPYSDLENSGLYGQADEAHRRLDAVDQERPYPVGKFNNNNIRTGVDDALRWLRNLVSQFGNFALNASLSVTRTIRDVFTGGNAAGGTVPGFAAGGQILNLVRGGRLPTSGPGTEITDGFLGVDRHGMPLVRVDAGEEVVNARASAKHRRLIKAINRDDPRIAELPAFETGGTIGSREAIERVIAEAYSSHNAGAVYSWGGTSRTAADCSGYVGRLGWTAMGYDPDTSGRMGTTYTLMGGQWPGFVRGTTGPFVIGVNSEHMAATVDGHPAESGGDVGGPSIGKGDGAWDPQFTEHWYLPHNLFSPPHSDAPVERTEQLEYADAADVQRPPQGEGGDARSVPLSPEGQKAAEKASQDENHPLFGTGADSWSDLGGNIAKSAVSGQIASVLKVLGIPDTLPPLVKAGKTWYQKVRDEASDKEIKEADEAIVEAAEADGETVDSAAAEAGVEPLAPAAPVDDGTPQSAGKRAVAPRGWDTGANWEALDFIYTKESGWNPHATNPSSGAFGIPQFNPVSGTLQQYLPDRSTDPFRQVEAGAQYIEDRYDTPIAARRFWEANNWYDRGGIARGKGHMLKNTLDPERVLSPEQTKAFDELVFNQLGDLASLAESIVSSGVSSAVGAGAGMADAVVPGAGAVLGPLGGPAGDLAGWYAGEVAGNLVQTGATFARDIGGILEAGIDAVVPTRIGDRLRGDVLATAPLGAPAQLAETFGPSGRVSNGDVHFHVGTMHEATHRARQIAADEVRGLIGV